MAAKGNSAASCMTGMARQGDAINQKIQVQSGKGLWLPQQVGWGSWDRADLDVASDRCRLGR